ncbi:MAG: cyclic nucleotide-binding domain-containing protein [Anderseniella sp.]|jgi:CRP-like cAMP-binding protein|nr:cyclic nucleotide-binding domain-containing protein [Anderseniella sp.]
MTIYDEIACLQQIPPFAALSPVKQKLLAVVSEHAVYMAGDTIIEQGEAGDAVYVLLDGVADVRIMSDGEDKLVRELGRNALFGEIAVMKNTPRVASVVARTMVHVLRIKKEVLHAMIRDIPELSRGIQQYIDDAGYAIAPAPQSA